MSTSRRERRQRQRPIRTHNRKLDWTKIKKEYRALAIIDGVLLLFLGLIFFCTAWSNNADRRKIAAAPVKSVGVIIDIKQKIRVGNYAIYKFKTSGVGEYNGQTLENYNGAVGDTIGVTYNKYDPTLNLLTKEMPEQTAAAVWDKVAFLAIILGSFLIVSPIIWGLAILFGYRRMWLDISSEIK